MKGMSTMRSGKAMNKLGLSVPELSALCLRGDYEAMFLDNTAFSFFWDSLQSPKAQGETINYFVAVIQKVELILATASKVLEEEDLAMIHRLANTLSFMAYTIPIRLDSLAITTSLQALQEANRKSHRLPLVEEIIRTVTKSIDKKEGMLIDSYVRKISNLLSSDELQMRNDMLRYPSLDGRTAKGGDLIPVFDTFLRKVLQSDGDVQEKIYDVIQSIMNNMRVLSKTFKISPELSMAQLFAQLHMLHVFLLHLDRIEEDVLAKLTSVLQQFFFWPRPCSDVVVSVMELLQSEHRSRGFVLLDRFLKESKLPQFSYKPSKWGQPVFYFMEAASEASVSLFQITCMTNLQGSDEEKVLRDHPELLVKGLSPTTQLQLIMHLLRSNLEVNVEDTLDLLSRMDPDVLPEAFYQMCVTAYEGTAIQGSIKECHAQVSQKYQEAWDLLTGAMMDDITLSDDITPSKIAMTPDLPDMVHLAIASSSKRIKKLFPSVSADASVNFPSTEPGRHFQDIITYHRSVADPSDPAIIRIMVAGGDQLFHAILCGYLEMQLQNPRLLQGLKVQWYVIPVDDSTLASFIARHDAWYYQHIFLPMRMNPPIVPWVEGHHLDWSTSQYPPSGPGKLTMSLFENYAKEARNEMGVAIHTIQCWASDGVGLMTIPFIGRVEVSVKAMAVRKKEIENDQRSVSDIVSDKHTSLQSNLVYAQFMKTTLNGTPIEVIAREEALDSVTIANISVAGDQCHPVDPNSRHVEFYGHYFDAKRGKYAFGDSGEIACTISSLELTAVSRSERFFMLIDGTSYGPFFRALFVLGNDCLAGTQRTSNPTSATEQSSISIQTFFPINSFHE